MTTVTIGCPAMVGLGRAAAQRTFAHCSSPTVFEIRARKRPCNREEFWIHAKPHSSKLGEERESEWPLVAPSHAVIEIEDVHLDLVSGVVTREMRHLQHMNNAARISVAPFDQLTQDMIEV